MELKELQNHILTLATLEETEAAVISCYFDLEAGRRGYPNALAERAPLLRKSLHGVAALRHFEGALTSIEASLDGGIADATKGLAVFARAGEKPFFLALQFRVALPNWISIDSVPNIYHLVELKDTYHRYVVMLATEAGARILGVNLGSVTEDVWQRRPDLQKRVGREWTKEHYQSHRRQRINQFVNEQVKILDQLMSRGGYGHLILAGPPRTTSQIAKALPKHLSARLVDIVPASPYHRTTEIVSATLRSFIEQEERESLDMVAKLHKEIKTNGLAVVGARACMKALKEKQVDALVLAKEYEPDPGWVCADCGTSEIERPVPKACPACEEGRIRELNIKEEMVRIAEQNGCGVEIVSQSDVLMRLGGVGCLLRFLGPEKYYAKAA